MTRPPIEDYQKHYGPDNIYAKIDGNVIHDLCDYVLLLEKALNCAIDELCPHYPHLTWAGVKQHMLTMGKAKEAAGE